MLQQSLHVDLVSHNPIDSVSGIGRYVRELHSRLQGQIAVQFAPPIDPPLTQRLSVLHHLPLGLRGRRPGSIVHFTQVMGCAQMFWSPVHPAIATVHDLGMLAWPPEAAMYNGLERALIRLSFAGLRRMDYLIADSEHTRRTLVATLGIAPERTRTVPLGIEHDRFYPRPAAVQALAAHYSLPPAGRWLLYVGSELPRKNLALLLQALAQVRRTQPDLHLLKVGGAGGSAFRATTLRLIAQLGLGDRVHFYENVPDADLPLFYSAADLYVCPSHLEGFGLPLLEALACGLPAVATTAGSLPELGGAAVLFVPPDDRHALTRALARLLADADLRARLRTDGLRQAARFSWPQTAADTLAVYRDLWAARSGDPQPYPTKGASR